MKKKGFTLIELLAVIVILAIIALIATPLVLKYIETARTNSKITSTQNYIKGVEIALANYSITNKGKSYPEGCYEINTLNTELDITMKGDMPSEGKVCIENNKIEKAIVKYPDNKVIKYEDDKSTVSDEETYESFNSVSNYIIDANVEFAYNESEAAYTATLQITKDIADEFQEAMDYDFIIDGGKAELIYVVEDSNSGLLFYSHVNDMAKLKGVLVNENEIIFLSVNELTGIHNVKIGNSRPIEERMYFAIGDNGNIAITGYDFIISEANVIIKDEEGTKYFNDTIEFADYNGNGIIGADAICRKNMVAIPEVYTALINGKTITVEVTQNIDGKEVTSSVSRNINSMMNISGLSSRYYILLIKALVH